jgi:putative phosphoesterase
MRIALISDLHGNELAVAAVLADAKQQGVDQVICLGDVATLGPRPSEVLARLKDGNIPTIMGNHDEFLIDLDLIRKYTEVPIIVNSIDWCRAQLNQAELDYVSTFQRTMKIPLEGDSTLFLYHGSPRSHMEDILATTPTEDLDRMLSGNSATVLAGGHTHIQMVRQHKGMLIVNPGSVGMPFKEYAFGQKPTVMAHAEYATVESRGSQVSVTAHRVPLDRRQLREAAAGSDNPLTPTLIEHYS